MSKKTGRRKTTKKPARLPERPLILPSGKGQRIPPFWSYGEDYKDAPRYTPRDGSPYWSDGMRLFGIELPADLGKAISAHGNETYSDIEEVFTFEPWRFFDHFPADAGDRYATPKRKPGDPPLPPDPDKWAYVDLGDPKSWTKDPRGGWDDFLDFSYAELMVLHAAINTAMAHGFYLALTRYADDLKNVPEAARMIAGMGRGRKLGAAVRRKQAAPKRMEHRKRFRELRKQGYTKTLAREAIHQDTGISVRQLERDTQGLN